MNEQEEIIKKDQAIYSLKKVVEEKSFEIEILEMGMRDYEHVDKNEMLSREVQKWKESCIEKESQLEESYRKSKIKENEVKEENVNLKMDLVEKKDEVAELKNHVKEKENNVRKSLQTPQWLCGRN